jgi:2,3-bisphosphoglycerate-dependent phosphoglycerate mutase
MPLRALLILLICCVTCNPVAAGNDGVFTLYFVRHAEKQADGSRDPALTEAGQHRAQQLAGWLQDKEISDVWSSDYKRTRDTAKPLATALGTDLTIYDPGKLTVLAGQLRNNSHNAYIVGHSNTTPELARLLCKCPIADMDESEYDRLIVISVNGNKTQIKTLQQSHLPKP